LTIAKRNKALKRPPLGLVHANTKSATNGELTTVDELVAKAHADSERLNEAEWNLLADNFHTNASQPRAKLNHVAGTFNAM
jgi:hypothetical protein